MYITQQFRYEASGNKKTVLYLASCKFPSLVLLDRMYTWNPEISSPLSSSPIPLTFFRIDLLSGLFHGFSYTVSLALDVKSIKF